MPRFKVDKLIRDHLPELLRTQSVQMNERFLEQDEYISKLKEKLFEEAEEIKHSQHPEELTEELADMLEVIQALAKTSGINWDEIEKTRSEKRKRKGGFDRKIYSPYADVEETNPAINYFQKQSTRYPKIENKSDCLFCQMAHSEFLETFTYCYAILDQFPVSKGHVLIIPYEHTENWFTASEEVRQDILKALHVMKDKLDMEYDPDGYNIGANCGVAAGQTIMHLHIHLIPRYKGDMADPKGGVRGVIPEKQKYH